MDTMQRPERDAVAAFITTAMAGNLSHPFVASRGGVCALTHSTIKPYQRIRGMGDGSFIRCDAIEQVSIRGSESVDDVLARFGWASPELAAEWLADGSTVILVTGATLKPKAVRADRRLGSVALDEVTPLYWKSVAFMVRRRD